MIVKVVKMNCDKSFVVCRRVALNTVLHRLLQMTTFILNTVGYDHRRCIVVRPMYKSIGKLEIRPPYMIVGPTTATEHPHRCSTVLGPRRTAPPLHCTAVLSCSQKNAPSFVNDIASARHTILRSNYCKKTANEHKN